MSNTRYGRRLRELDADSIAATFASCDHSVDDQICAAIRAEVGPYVTITDTNPWAAFAAVECFFQHPERIEIGAIRLVDR